MNETSRNKIKGHDPVTKKNNSMTDRKSTISPFSIIIVFTCLSIIGIAITPYLSIHVYPSAIAPSLSVSYYWPEVSARVLETEVTGKLESLLAAVRDVKNISSISSKGFGRIDISFKQHINRDAKRFEVASLIRQCYPELPSQVSYPQITDNNFGEENTPVLSYAINASINSHYIRKYAESEIVPALAQIEGISSVHLYGVTPYKLEIEFRMENLQSLAISVDDLAKAINTYFKSDLLGISSHHESGQKRVERLLVELRYNVADTLLWENIPVKNVGGRIIYLKDVAKVRYKEQTPNSYYRINGLNTLGLVIYARKNVNNIALAKLVREKVHALRQRTPLGYSVLSKDSTEYLLSEINNAFSRGVFSLFILLLFIRIISRKFRYLLIVLACLVATITTSFILFYLLDVELQIYSLAGITISIAIMINVNILVIEHVRAAGGKKMYLAVFGAILLIITAFVVIFFFGEQQRLNLEDFAKVVIINLVVGFCVVTLLVPALMQNIALAPYKIQPISRRRWLAIIKKAYEFIIIRAGKIRWIIITAAVLAFGIPIYLLPEKVKGEHAFARIYNSTFGSDWYNDDLRPITDKILGGSLRLFLNASENLSSAQFGKTILHVEGRMPEGCSVQQMNEAIEQVEYLVSRYEEVLLFQTNVLSYKDSKIEIYFKSQYEAGDFPFLLKNRIESEVINLGGADWRVYGVGRGFSNIVEGESRDIRVLLEGYNYEQLYRFAELFKERLLQNTRIRQVDILGSESRNSKSIHEFFISLDSEWSALHGVSTADFYLALKKQNYHREINEIYVNDELWPVFLTSNMFESFNTWDFNNQPIDIKDTDIKLGGFASIEKRKSGNDIYKRDQQYRLIVAYDFIGPENLSAKVRDDIITEFRGLLPLGYSIRGSRFSSRELSEENQYFFVVVAIVAIYFISAILLESLVQPFCIIAMIPISFIGVFLTFHFFEVPFGHGGFASFILLCGLIASVTLFVVNDYNKFLSERKCSRLKSYLKAINGKIGAVMLTVLSTALFLSGFFIKANNDSFWFSFATATIAGLIFSLIGILLYLPLFLGAKKTENLESGTRKK